MSVLPKNTPQPTSAEEFLETLAQRLGAVQKGGWPDIERAERWFVQWWRSGGAVSTPSPYGWGFDFDFTPELEDGAEPPSGEDVERIMGKVVDDYVLSLHDEGGEGRTSMRQEKKTVREAKIKARMQRRVASGTA